MDSDGNLRYYDKDMNSIQRKNIRKFTEKIKYTVQYDNNDTCYTFLNIIINAIDNLCRIYNETKNIYKTHITLCIFAVIENNYVDMNLETIIRNYQFKKFQCLRFLWFQF